jgi:MoxR-like ATPase
VRFEEIARCPQHIQDAMLSIMSERQILVPELGRENGVLFAREGFNIIATSNSLDQGVNAMSAALKRRMNFETIPPIRELQDEIEVVASESEKLIRLSGVDVKPDAQIIEVLTTIFHELRNGQTLDGRSTDRLAATVMSTAEAVSVAHAMGVHAYYYRNGKMEMGDLVHFLIGAALKDNKDDRRRMKHYFETEVAVKEGTHWQAVFEQRRLL